MKHSYLETRSRCVNKSFIITFRMTPNDVSYQNDDLHAEHETLFAKHLTALMMYLQLFPGQNLKKITI
jgi:hypothetical protein